MTAVHDARAPQTWRAALAQRRPPVFEVPSWSRVVVVAAHPDDETLGAGPALRALVAAGAEPSVVVATDGEAAHPGLHADQRRRLGAARRLELAEALRVQGLGDAEVTWLGLPDSALAEHRDELTRALVPLLAGADACLAPWPDDPHPDHRAAGLAALDAAPVSAHRWSYPVWMWPWLDPDDPSVPWSRAHAVPVDAAERAVRRAAVDRFVSQLEPGPDGSPPVLAKGQLQHLERDTDLLFHEPRSTSAPVDRFRELYAGGRDPWNTDSWYERRKRATVLAALPRERYRSALEPACGAGELTVGLAGRCDRVRASDPVADAVSAARARGLPGVEVTEEALPAAVHGGPVDLVVLSEVLYYLDDAVVAATLDRVADVLEPEGDLVVVHWRGWPAEAPRDAAATHRAVAAHPAFDEVVAHTDEGFLLHVLRRR